MKFLFNRLALQLLAGAVLIGSASRQAHATPFTSGNLAIFQADPTAVATNTAISIVEINTTATNQVPAQTISISGTGANALRASGSATSNGLLALTNDRTLLSFAGHNNTNTAANANTLNPRGVGTIDANGNFNLATTYTGTSGNQTRGVTALDNSNWFISDQGGIYTNGASSASPTANTRGIKSFGGTVYALQQSGTATNIVVNTVSAPSGGTITGLPGLTNNSAATDFYLLSSGNNGTYDELYITSGTAAGTGISKFSLVAGSWTSNGTAAVSGGLYGIAAALDPLGGADLYVTSGSGGAAANSVLKFVDSAGFNSAITLGAATTLYTAPAGAVNKGLDFAPVPEPSTFLLGALGLIGFATVVRNRRLVSARSINCRGCVPV